MLSAEISGLNEQICEHFILHSELQYCESRHASKKTTLLCRMGHDGQANKKLYYQCVNQVDEKSTNQGNHQKGLW